MIRIVQNLVSRKAALALAAVVGLGTVAAAPQKAQADFRIGFDIRDYDQRCERRETRVWVEPVYQTVCDRVWVAPACQTVTERVWVPDRYEERQVVRGYGWDRRVVCERVLVQPAHYELQNHEVQVSSGYWTNVERQVCVAPGHWETRVDRIAYADHSPHVERLHIEFGHR